MIKDLKIKVKLPIPDNANVLAKVGEKIDKTLLYEIDQLEILEEVMLSKEKVNFNVKDGQYVSKGEIIFTEGFMGHKAMISDFGGIVEISSDKVRILGQKRHIERTVNIPGKLIRLVPNKYVVIESQLTSVAPVVYFSEKKVLSPKVYLKDKSEIVESNFKFPNFNFTYFVNDNLYLDELSKMIAFGARRIIVNGLFVDNLASLTRELNKLDGFAVISGFGEMISRRFLLDDLGYDVFWGSKSVFFAEKLEKSPPRIFEHPFWGMTGLVNKKDNIRGEVDYDGEKIEFYLKNLEHFARPQ